MNHANRFNTFDEVVDRFKPQYHIKTAQQEAILWEFLENTLQEDGETLILLPPSKVNEGQDLVGKVSCYSSIFLSDLTAAIRT